MTLVLPTTLTGYRGRPRYGGRLFYSPGARFRTCGYAGLICALVVTAILGSHLRLSLATLFCISVGSILSFFVHVLFSRYTGRVQQLVFYRYFITVTAIAAFLSWLMTGSILPYLDVTVIGFGAFAACGRIGCLMVGCCHGRPARFGICYQQQHVTRAFPPQLLCIRLFPIQAVESIWLCFIVIIACYQSWRGYVPGAAFSWFITAYCPARFLFEFLRWRPADAYYGGLSEAQWTSVFFMLVLVTLGVFRILPFVW